MNKDSDTVWNVWRRLYKAIANEFDDKPAKTEQLQAAQSEEISKDGVYDLIGSVWERKTRNLSPGCWPTRKETNLDWHMNKQVVAGEFKKAHKFLDRLIKKIKMSGISEEDKEPLVKVVDAWHEGLDEEERTFVE